MEKEKKVENSIKNQCVRKYAMTNKNEMDYLKLAIQPKNQVIKAIKCFKSETAKQSRFLNIKPIKYLIEHQKYLLIGTFLLQLNTWIME